MKKFNRLIVIVFIIIICSLLVVYLGSSTNAIGLKKLSENEIDQLQKKYADSHQSLMNETIDDISDEKSRKFAIQSSHVITENSEEFLEGSMNNLTINKDGYLSLDKEKYPHNEWENISIAGPSPRARHSMVYNSHSAKVVLFGGMNDTFLFDDTWIYDTCTNSWTEMNPTTAPSRRRYHSMAYDSYSDKIILYGGFGWGGVNLGDTWIYDLSTDTWTQRFPTITPGVRWGHSMVYNSHFAKIVLFGGVNSASGVYFNDTWAYDLPMNTWTQLNTSIIPEARYGHSMAYDSSSDKVVMFGGLKPPGFKLDDTWVYDLLTNTWTQMNPSNPPSARTTHSMVYDSVNRKIILFGGTTGYDDNKTYIYDLSTNNWNYLHSEMTLGERDGHSMVFDSNFSKIILFGGWRYGTNPLTDTLWILPFLSGYCQTGSYLSKLYSLENIHNLTGTITWNPLTQPENTSLKIQVGLSNTTTDVDFQYTSYSTSEFTFKSLARYLRYRGIFESNVTQLSTPILNVVNIYYSLEKPKPVVQITNIPNNSLVEGLVTISAIAEAPNGIEKVCFYIDGFLLSLDYSTPYICSWNSTRSENGYVSLIVVAFSVLGRDSMDSIRVIVNNPVIEVPNAPQDLSATVGDQFVELSWSPPSDDGGSVVTHYNIYRGSTTGDYLLLGITLNTNFTDETAVGGKEYYYVITAVNTVGESNFSNEVSSSPSEIPETVISVPNAPQDLSAADGDQFIELSWSPPSDDDGSVVTHYNVYRGTSSGSYQMIGIVTGLSTSFNDTLFVGGTTYYYVVTALNSMGESTFSNEVSVTAVKSRTSPYIGISMLLLSLGILVVFIRKYKKA